MLTITPQASEAIRGVLDTQNAPEGSVLRISPQPGDASLVVSIADSPEAGDQIVAGEEVEICVESTAAQALDDKELDATIVGGQVSFSIGEQEGAPGEGPGGPPDPDREGPTPDSANPESRE